MMKKIRRGQLGDEEVSATDQKAGRFLWDAWMARSQKTQAVEFMFVLLMSFVRNYSGLVV